MDCYNIPKKVNRHVLKALTTLSGNNINEPISLTSIRDQVKYQMKNLIPVSDFDNVIKRSLLNMSNIGIIDSYGTKGYAIGHNYDNQHHQKSNLHFNPYPKHHQPPKKLAPNRRLFQTGRKKRKSHSRLDPNSRKTCLSKTSLTGDIFEQSRKRLRTNNKQLRYKGNKTVLPRVRQHKPLYSTNDFYAIDDKESLDLLETDCEKSSEIHLNRIKDDEATTAYPNIGISATQLNEHLKNFSSQDMVPLYFDNIYLGKVNLGSGISESISSLMICNREEYAKSSDDGEISLNSLSSS